MWFRPDVWCTGSVSYTHLVKALEDINLDINQGEIFGIIGLSGAGKSTLVRCINYLEVPTAGEVVFEGVSLTSSSKKNSSGKPATGRKARKELELTRRKARQSMGMIFQQFNLLAQRNVIDNVCFPLEIAKVPRKEARARAEELLKLVGLEAVSYTHLDVYKRQDCMFGTVLEGKTVVLGVTGSIAAYKIASLASMLKKMHADVEVIMTKNATEFISPVTFESLTGKKCLVETFDRDFEFSVEHVALAKRADVFLIAPASANVIGKVSHGIADDMLTTTFLACGCHKIIAPAMNLSLIHI